MTGEITSTPEKSGLPSSAGGEGLLTETALHHQERSEERTNTLLVQNKPRMNPSNFGPSMLGPSMRVGGGGDGGDEVGGEGTHAVCDEGKLSRWLLRAVAGE